jgi:hypothetical protein
MPKTICRSIPVQTTLDTSVRFLPAPVILSGGINISQHNLPDYEFQATTAVVAGAEEISLSLINPPPTTPITGVFLDAGTVLLFPGVTLLSPKIRVTTAESVTLLPTTPVVIPTLEIPAAIAASAIAKDKALLFLPGARSSIVTPTIKTEDVTNFGSGTGMEMVVTGNSKKVAIELDLVYNNKAHREILAMMYADDNIGREAYIEVLFNSGEKHEGYALMTSAAPAGAVQAKRSVNLEFQFQGGCYVYTEALITP